MVTDLELIDELAPLATGHPWVHPDGIICPSTAALFGGYKDKRKSLFCFYHNLNKTDMETQYWSKHNQALPKTVYKEQEELK